MLYKNFSFKMNYRNVCFSCHSYIGDQIHFALQDTQKKLNENPEEKYNVAPTFDIMELSKGKAISFVGQWMDSRGIIKYCCRDAIRDATMMDDYFREVNLNRL